MNSGFEVIVCLKSPVLAEVSWRQGLRAAPVAWGEPMTRFAEKIHQRLHEESWEGKARAKGDRDVNVRMRKARQQIHCLTLNPFKPVGEEFLFFSREPMEKEKGKSKKRVRCYTEKVERKM